MFVPGGGNAVFGQNVELDCRVRNPPSSSSYVFNLMAPTGSTSIERGTNETNADDIIVTFSAAAEDTGTYTCTATDTSDQTVLTTATGTLVVGKWKKNLY